jgi:type IV pilus assembly protein PilC
LVKASEASGTMAMMLDRVGDYLNRELRTRRQVTGALTYPAFMLGTAFAVVGFMLVVILPRFARIYEMKATTLPTPTRVMITMGDFLREDWMWWGPAILVLALAFSLWRRTDGGRKALDWVKLRLPIIGPMTAMLYVARSTRTMATLLAGGVGLLDVIRICRGITNNRAFDELWIDMECRVRDGKPMSGAFTDSIHVPPDVASMIASGERSGRLSEVMEKVAARSDETLESSIKHATSMIEPILIVVMGIIVGSVAMALLLPVFKMSSMV